MPYHFKHNRFVKVTLGILVFMFCLLFTSVGHQVLIWGANKSIKALNIQLKAGRLFSGSQVDIVWQSESLLISANNMKPTLSWFTCSTLCFELSTEKITLKMTDSHIDTAKNDDKSDALSQTQISWKLPIDIGLTTLHIDELTLQQNKRTIKISDINSSGTFNRGQLSVNKTTISHILLSDTQKDTPESERLSELAAIAPLKLTSLVNMTVAEVSIDKIELETVTKNQVINQFRVLPKFTGQAFNWQDLYFEYEQFVVRSDGYFNSSTKNNPINLVHGVTTITSPDSLMMLKLTGDLSSVKLDVNVQGAKQANIIGNVDFTQVNWPFSLSANVYNLPFSYQIREKLFNATMQQADISLAGQANDYTLEIDVTADQQELSVLSAHVSGQGNLTAISDFSGRLIASKGSANISGRFDWANQINTKLNLVMDELPLFFIDKQSFLSGVMAVEANQHQVGWDINIPIVDVDGKIANLPLALDASFKLDEQLFGDVERLKMSLGDSLVELSGSLQKTLHLNGKIDISHQRNEVFPFDVNANGKLEITGPHRQPLVIFNTQVPKFENSQLKVEQAHISSSIDLSQRAETEIEVMIGAVSFSEHHINNVVLKLNGNQQKHWLTLSSEGDMRADVSLAGQIDKQGWQGEITAGKIQYSDFDSHFKHHARFRFEDQATWYTGKLCGELNQAPWCIEASEANSHGWLSGDIHAFNLDTINTMLSNKIHLTGQTKLATEIQWQDKKITKVNANAQIADAEITHSNLVLPIEKVDIQVLGDTQSLNADWQLSSSLVGKLVGDIRAQVQDNRLYSATAAIEVKQLALAPIGELANHLLPQPINLTGQMSSELRLSGDIEHPELEGYIQLTEFGIDQSSLPVRLVNSHFSLDFDGKKARVSGDLNTDAEGRLGLKGQLNWQDSLHGEIDLSGQDIRVNPQQDISLLVSPDIKLAYAKQHISLTGLVEVPQGRIAISQMPEQVVEVSDDQIIIDSKQASDTALPFSYALDLDVSLEDDFRVFAFGLDSYVHGKISLDKLTDTPLVASGEFKLREGVYKALGQDLLIEQGQIGFNGPLSRPYLNVKAIRNPDVTADDVIAGLELTGSASNPRLNIFSQPAMDQAHALSYLLNGEPLDKSENNNNALISQILLAQSLNFSESFINKAGKKFGIEDVSVSAKGSGDETQVELSGYITPSVQVSYRVGVFEAINEIAIRYRVFSKLYIEATSGLYDSIDLLYQFDWDPE